MNFTILNSWGVNVCCEDVLFGCSFIPAIKQSLAHNEPRKEEGICFPRAKTANDCYTETRRTRMMVKGTHNSWNSFAES